MEIVARLRVEGVKGSGGDGKLVLAVPTITGNY